MRAVTFGKFALTALAIVALCVMSAPLASATSCSGFSLSTNNLGLSGEIGCVTVANSGTNQVTVTITMDAGYSVKLNGGDIAFNLSGGPSSITAGTVSIESGAYSGTFKGLKTDQNISAFGTFAFDFTNVKGQPGGVVSADNITFTLTGSGLTASEFTAFAIHFCTASGTNCGPSTGFATNGPPPTTTPEPGSMALLGTGLLSLAGIVRRRLKQ